MILFILSFLFLGSTMSSASVMTLPESLSVVNGCTIFSMKGVVQKSYPGRFCLFLEDGSIVSSTATSLKYINPDNSIRWEIPGNYPRHLNISIDGKRILTFRSFIDKSTKEFWRQDELMVIDLEGKILAQKKIGDLIPLKAKWPSGMQKEIEADLEASHFNSIYEIPAIKGKHDAAFKEGHIIANCAHFGAFVLTPDLTMVKRFTLEELKSPLSHDVQVTPQGKLLYFANEIKIPSGLLASGVRIYDPLKKKIDFEFKPNPPEIFYSECCGSVQLVQEKYLFLAGFLGGGYFIDLKTSKITQQFLVSLRNGNTSYQTSFLLKVVDVTNFLSKRKD